MPTSGDFRSTAPIENLRLRAQLLSRIRRFFDAQGYLEVETPLLSHDSVVDRHLDPIEVFYGPDHGTTTTGRRLFLQTSPELGMKRLLASGGFDAIYQTTRAFRREEQGARHNPEFTMIEWYRLGDGMAEQMELLDDLCRMLFGTPPAERLTYEEAFKRYAGLDPHQADLNEVRSKTYTATSIGEHVPPAAKEPGGALFADRDFWLNLLLSELVEPNLGQAKPTILYDFPASQAALAKTRPGPPEVAERFELYLGGFELANGYHELLDADVLEQRNRTQNRLRDQDGKPTLPNDSRLIAAMKAGLPACSGVALGFDRLVMYAVGASDISEVIAFPFDRA
ncbi:MAG TPA: EF-P lysine aminoacylase EpmA [Pirellulales bacterium]